MFEFHAEAVPCIFIFQPNITQRHLKNKNYRASETSKLVKLRNWKTQLVFEIPYAGTKTTAVRLKPVIAEDCFIILHGAQMTCKFRRDIHQGCVFTPWQESIKQVLQYSKYPNNHPTYSWFQDNSLSDLLYYFCTPLTLCKPLLA